MLAPKKFIQRLKRDKESFRSYMHQVRASCRDSWAKECRALARKCHTASFVLLLRASVYSQDAHEFLNYLLNHISELLEAEARKRGSPLAAPGAPKPPTFVQELFEGRYVSEMRCLQCETVSSREDSFVDLGLQIEHNTSLTSCLRNFRSAHS